MKQLSYKQMKQVESQNRYQITKSGEVALKNLEIIDELEAMDEIREVYDLAVNEGVIKEPMTDVEKIEWFARGNDEYLHPVYKNCKCQII